MNDKRWMLDEELASLDEKELGDIRDAYMSFEPDPEAEERMWAAISAAAGKKQSEAEGVASQRIRQVRPLWRRVLPVAACLVAGAIAVGTAGSLLLGNQSESPAVLQANGGYTDSVAKEETAGAALYDMAETERYVEDALPYDLPEGFNTEEYSYVDERGFVSTRLNPLSTVSSDVDTASYANLRRMIRDGYGISDIPQGAVRIEEMLNYFRYDYETPEGDALLAQTVSVGVCPWNPDTQLLVMGFATAPESEQESNGSNLVFLIDVSGSMSGQDRLGLLQDSFATLVEGLDQNDTISIVTYSGSEEVVLEGASGSEKEKILRAIYSLKADGYTNGEAGLKMAYEIARRNYIEGGVNRIVMASDGDLNVGMSSESDLHDYVEKQRGTGIYLSVLGFGAGNYKDNKMEVLADCGNGSYHYIDCYEEAKRVFEENLTANIVPLADDVKIQVEFNPSEVKGYRLIGYENRTLATEDFRNDEANAGDIGPGTQFTVAYEIVRADSPFEVYEPQLTYDAGLQGQGSAASNEWLTCTMRYKRAGSSEISEQSFAVTQEDAMRPTSDDWRFAAAVIEAGMVMRGSDYRGTASISGALEILSEMPLDEDRQAFAELVGRIQLSSRDEGLVETRPGA